MESNPGSLGGTLGKFAEMDALTLFRKVQRLDIVCENLFEASARRAERFGGENEAPPVFIVAPHADFHGAYLLHRVERSLFIAVQHTSLY